jgi:hypothetical protein
VKAVKLELDVWSEVSLLDGLEYSRVTAETISSAARSLVSLMPFRDTSRITPLWRPTSNGR